MMNLPTRLAPVCAVAGVRAVIVTFNPNRASLCELLDRLAPQVASITVVDNASAAALPDAVAAAGALVRLDRNVGVAAAQNVGIRDVVARGASFVLLMDQDSLPAPDMVRQLVETHDRLTARGVQVGAVGARIADPDGEEEGFVRFRDGRYEAVRAADGDEATDCDMLIASGTLIPVQALAAIGDMDERLFIDKVDTEWCLRARAKGWRLAGSPTAVLKHRLGDGSVRVWFGGWRSLRVHKPFRYYYMVRNAMLLRRSPHRTWAWARAERRQLLSIVIYFGVMSRQGLAPLRMMWDGLVDGLRGVDGPRR